jgi:hypothetical protein
MARRTHPDAVAYALEQEFFEKGEERYSDEDHRLAFLSQQKRYLGSVKRGERAVHYWWVIADEEMMTIDDGPGGVIISGNLESPLKRIPQKEMTVEELEQSGEYEIPPVMMRELSYLSEMGASVMGPLEYRACDVLLPLLGIKIVPESDAEYVDFEQIDWEIIEFSVSSKKPH